MKVREGVAALAALGLGAWLGDRAGQAVQAARQSLEDEEERRASIEALGSDARGIADEALEVFRTTLGSGPAVETLALVMRLAETLEATLLELEAT